MLLKEQFSGDYRKFPIDFFRQLVRDQTEVTRAMIEVMHLVTFMYLQINQTQYRKRARKATEKWQRMKQIDADPCSMVRLQNKFYRDSFYDMKQKLFVQEYAYKQLKNVSVKKV